jgi:hypothetical protein
MREGSLRAHGQFDLGEILGGAGRTEGSRRTSEQDRSGHFVELPTAHPRDGRPAPRVRRSARQRTRRAVPPPKQGRSPRALRGVREPAPLGSGRGGSPGFCVNLHGERRETSPHGDTCGLSTTLGPSVRRTKHRGIGAQARAYHGADAPRAKDPAGTNRVPLGICGGAATRAGPTTDPAPVQTTLQTSSNSSRGALGSNLAISPWPRLHRKFDRHVVPAINASSHRALSKPDIGPTSSPNARAARMKYPACSAPLRKAVDSTSAGFPANMGRRSLCGESCGHRS